MQRAIADEIETIYGLVDDQPSLQRIVREVNCLMSTRDTTEPERVIGLLLDELEAIQAENLPTEAMQAVCPWPGERLTEEQRSAIECEGTIP